MTKNKKGFTLVELMVVVGIIGILVALAIPSMLDSAEKARDATAAQNIYTIKTATQSLLLTENFSRDNDLYLYPGSPDKVLFEQLSKMVGKSIEGQYIVVVQTSRTGHDSMEDFYVYYTNSKKFEWNKNGYRYFNGVTTKGKLQPF